MLALYDHIPQEYIDQYNNEYGLIVEPKPNWKVITMCFVRDGKDFRLNDSILGDYDSARNLSDVFYRNAPGNSVSSFPSISSLRKDFGWIKSIPKTPRTIKIS
jgi:hypothetical protein